ncbi:hypothetical protein D9C73_015628 [Collichthys lucidus]|uniref:Uncharacterized protein n=1 Tax=Collichthys lucidus TaxID=240159 RepID=A0A4U5V1H7_COLLU|nr:hypothetical protein D9C73_015628 [Collichthys lucidus]
MAQEEHDPPNDTPESEDKREQFSALEQLKQTANSFIEADTSGCVGAAAAFLVSVKVCILWLVAECERHPLAELMKQSMLGTRKRLSVLIFLVECNVSQNGIRNYYSIFELVMNIRLFENHVPSLIVIRIEDVIIIKQATSAICRALIRTACACVTEGETQTESKQLETAERTRQRKSLAAKPSSNQLRQQYYEAFLIVVHTCQQKRTNSQSANGRADSACGNNLSYPRTSPVTGKQPIIQQLYSSVAVRLRGSSMQ